MGTYESGLCDACGVIGGDGVVIIEEFEPRGVKLPPPPPPPVPLICTCPSRELMFA